MPGKNRTDAEIARLRIGCKEAQRGDHAGPASPLGRLAPELADETLDGRNRILGSSAAFRDTLAILRFRRLFRNHQGPVRLVLCLTVAGDGHPDAVGLRL